MNCNSTVNIVKIIYYQQIRYLARWASRRPVRVIQSEEYDEEKDEQIKNVRNTFSEEIQDESINQMKINWKQPKEAKEANQSDRKPLDYKIKTKFVKPLTTSKSTSKSEFDMLETIIDSDGNFIYTKMKNNDSRITRILTEIKSKQEKVKKDLILLEGKRLIKEALCTKCKLEYILFSRMQEVQYLRPFLPKMGAQLYKMPYREMQLWSNLTTNPGIMGIFKIPDVESIQPPPNSLPLTVICDNVREGNNLGAILRTCSGAGTQEIILTKGCVNVWDSKVLRSACGAHFKLRIKKQKDWTEIRDSIPLDSAVYIADNQILTANNPEDVTEAIQTVPLLPYYGIEFSKQRHNVLIIGGETEGISAESYKFAAEMKGIRLNIPLCNEVDSLNTGTALGIIVFEVKKQFLSHT